MSRMSKKSMMFLFIAVTFLTVMAAVLFFDSDVNAQQEQQKNAYYRCIHIDQGDNLWNLAEKYAPEKNKEGLCRYVDHLLSLNSLSRDAVLKIGQPLMIIYYE